MLVSQVCISSSKTPLQLTPRALGEYAHLSANLLRLCVELGHNFDKAVADITAWKADPCLL